MIASLALELRGHAEDDASFAALVVRWVQRNVRWVREPGERFAVARATVRAGVGDCDCTAILVAALLLAGGLEARLVALKGESGDLVHGLAQALIPSVGWMWADASIPSPFGTDPRTVGRLPA